MAKLEAYYTLCPLIDQQNFLGVKKDTETGCAIVTLGRNIVIRYKLQDLKQISSWSSKERLSSEVIYDATTEKYIAVFNEKSVKSWPADETNLESVKKYKFRTQLHKILTLDGIPPILVLQNGATASLHWALDKKNRKQWNSAGFLKKDEQLLDCQLISVNHATYFCAFTMVDRVFNYVFVPLKGLNFFEDVENLNRIELKRSSETLAGHVILHDKNKAHLLSLWSNGRLYSYPIISTSAETVPGTLVSEIKSVNTNYPVMMVPLNESTIAMYGADAAEEGAVLAIYNVQFKLTQAIQRLKLYTKEAKLWKVDDSLLLAANRHLAVAPYRLAAQKIGAMVGSSLNMMKPENSSNDDIMIIQESSTENWEDPESKIKKTNLTIQLSSQLPKTIAKKISRCVNEGLDDADIQQAVMDDLIESRDVKSIVWCLNNFMDLPENLLLNLILFGLRSEEEVFTPVQNGHSDKKDIVSTRNEFLDRVFAVAISDMYLLDHIKSSLKFDEALTLLDYLIGRINDEGETIYDNKSVQNYKQLCKWACLLLDSHYQQYLLSRDPNVLDRFKQLNEVLESHVQLVSELENLQPIIKRLINGKSLKITSKENSKLYSIEDIKLY